ncbi:hypothetical protein D3C84_894660 [compost metagenome]
MRECIQIQGIGADLDVQLRPFNAPAVIPELGLLEPTSLQRLQPRKGLQVVAQIQYQLLTINEGQGHSVIRQYLHRRQPWSFHG